MERRDFGLLGIFIFFSIVPLIDMNYVILATKNGENDFFFIFHVFPHLTNSYKSVSLPFKKIGLYVVCVRYKVVA